MKLGLYENHVRLFLNPNEAERLIGGLKNIDTFVSISGDWDTGYIIEGHSDKISGRRKLSSRGTKWSGWYSHYIDLHKDAIKCPFGNIGSVEVEFELLGHREMKLLTYNIANNIVTKALAVPTKEIAKVAKGKKPKTERAIVKASPSVQKVLATKTPLPAIPAGWVDLSAMEVVPVSGVGLAAAQQLLNDELAKYNANSLTPLEIDVIDNRIVFKPVGLKVA